jgi:hypothetical protein
MKTMKIFYVKTLVFQTIFYFLLWFLPNLDKNIIKEVDIKSWGFMVIVFYIISVITTFIIPMIKEIINENDRNIPNENTSTSEYANNKNIKSLKLAKVDDYWLIVDDESEIKAKDFILFKSGENYNILQIKDNELPYNNAKHGLKILASSKFIDKSIPMINIIEQSSEEFDLDNAKKFAKKYFYNLKEKYPKGGQITIDNILSLLEVGVECGYKFGKKHQAKSSDKKYTDKQLEDAITMAFDIAEYGIFNSTRDDAKSKIIQSLNQPKTT